MNVLLLIMLIYLLNLDQYCVIPITEALDIITFHIKKIPYVIILQIALLFLGHICIQIWLNKPFITYKLMD